MQVASRGIPRAACKVKLARQDTRTLSDLGLEETEREESEEEMTVCDFFQDKFTEVWSEIT